MTSSPDTQDTEELKPCPIDDGPAEWREHPIRGTGASGMEAPDLSIRCTICGLETTRERTEEWERGRGTYSIRDQAEAKLLARWNTRPDSPVTVIREAGKALLAMLDEAFPFGDAIGRPTIAELEAMLASKAPGSIEIRPNGSIHVVPREEIEAFREALARISR